MYERFVKEIMSRDLISCAVETSLIQVMQRMTEYAIHALVVLDEDGYAVGIVTQLDVLVAQRRTVLPGMGPITAGEIMSPIVLVCNPDMTLLEAATLMTRNHISRLIVAKPNCERIYPLGLVSMTDLIRHAIKETSAPPSLRLQRV